MYTKMCIFKRVVQIHIILHSTPERLLSRTPQGSAARTKIQLTVGFTEYHMENYYKFESVSIINNFNNLYPLLIRMLKSRIYAMHVVFVGGQIRVRHFVRKSQWKSPPKGKFTIWLWVMPIRRYEKSSQYIWTPVWNFRELFSWRLYLHCLLMWYFRTHRLHICWTFDVEYICGFVRWGSLQTKSMTSQRAAFKMADTRYYGNVMTTTRWLLYVTMETLWQQQDDGYALLCSTSSTVQS